MCYIVIIYHLFLGLGTGAVILDVFWTSPVFSMVYSKQTNKQTKQSIVTHRPKLIFLSWSSAEDSDTSTSRWCPSGIPPIKRLWRPGCTLSSSWIRDPMVVRELRDLGDGYRLHGHRGQVACAVALAPQSTTSQQALSVSRPTGSRAWGSRCGVLWATWHRACKQE